MERDDRLRRFAALAAEGGAYVLVGGVAMNLHGVVRATEDVDPGVRRYASIEAEDADRRAADVARMRQLRERATG